MEKNSISIIFLSVTLLLSVLLSGCIQLKKPEFEAPFSGAENINNNPTVLCIQLCQQKLSEGTDLSTGPCLSNNITENWVCDVAHDPRQVIDNQPRNQCPAFLNGTAKHFVEVDTECNLIRIH